MILSFLTALLILAVQPGFVLRVDPRQFDEERYVSICGGIYQRAETWVCVEVARD